jgi:hypothetical protein
MKRIRGTYNGTAVILREKVDLRPNTEVEVLIPEAQEKSLTATLDALDKKPITEALSLDEIVALVHEIRAAQR